MLSLVLCSVYVIVGQSAALTLLLLLIILLLLLLLLHGHFCNEVEVVSRQRERSLFLLLHCSKKIGNPNFVETEDFYYVENQ